jgi:phosphoglycolate phosphatase-like HAD superfamily hydrolase
MLLVLFDIDGTLLRLAREPVRRALQEAFAKVLCCWVPEEWLRDLAGKTDLAIFAEVARRCGLPEEEVRARMPMFARVYAAGHRRWVRRPDVFLLPGVKEVLEELGGVPSLVLGVLTGNLQPIALWKLRQAGIAHYFRLGAFGSDHWERTQLLPVVWQRARQLGIPVDGTVLVGDSPRDVFCARYWGLPCIAVATGPADAETLRACGAQTVLSSFAEVEIVRQMLYELHAQADHCN